MLVAAIDTSTLTLSCALVELGGAGVPPRVRQEMAERAPPSVRPKHSQRHAEPARTRVGAVREVKPSIPPATPPGALGGHSERLPRALLDLLRAEGLGLSDVGGYAVGLGPGSFTGLRIGLATWKALAYAKKRPIAGCSSLAAMALAAAVDAKHGSVLVPLLDARKGEVYAGFYETRDGSIVEVADEAALAPQALAARVGALAAAGREPLAFGEGYDAYAGAFSGVARLRTEVMTPPARAVAALVAERLSRGAYDAQVLFALEPHYVRPSEAELKFPKGLGPGRER